MSILPSHTQGSASSSSSSFSSQNPNFNHGFSIDQQQQPHQFSLSSSPPPSLDSLSISGPQSSGSMVEEATKSSGSSRKVNGYGSSKGKKTSLHHIINNRAPTHSPSQGGVGSSQSSGEISGSPPNGRPNGTRRKYQTVSGNHLLNFQYNPISRPQNRAPPSRRPQKVKPYNKDLFLQANYKFVVLDSGNYTIESMDPDKMLQWEDIICVRYSTPHPIQCPICLDIPLCPQITSCGHIFCFPCILQYLFMGEDNHKAECWRKCPLCFMMISSRDLYTIYTENVREHSIGEDLEFMLLTRKKNSFSLHEKLEGGMSTKLCDSYSKFTLTLDVDLSVREAISELDNWLVRAEVGLVDDLEKLPYVCAAMEHLKQRKKYWNSRRNCGGGKSCENNDCEPVSSNVNHSFDHADFGRATLNRVYVDEKLEDVIHGGDPLVRSCENDECLEGNHGSLSSSFDESKILQASVEPSGDTIEKDSYNFYQAADGQPIILHPLNMKCLLHHYGSYDQLPARLNGKILQLESVTQSEAMRRRYRPLSHFPLTTTFQLCEIDLREILSTESLGPFMDEIKKREKQRKQLAKKEHQDKMKAEAVAAYSLPVPYNSIHAFCDSQPTFSMDDFGALGNSAATVSSSPPLQGRQLFSNVARLGFAAGCDSPSLNIQDTPPDSDSISSSSSRGLNGSTNQRSFANAISQERPTESVESRKMNEVGKKGKKPSRVLLSTAGGRRY